MQWRGVQDIRLNDLGDRTISHISREVRAQNVVPAEILRFMWRWGIKIVLRRP